MEPYNIIQYHRQNGKEQTAYTDQEPENDMGKEDRLEEWKIQPEKKEEGKPRKIKQWWLVAVVYCKVELIPKKHDILEDRKRK